MKKSEMKEREVWEEKEYRELEFTDDFLFCKIMQNNPDLCCELVEVILGKKVRLCKAPEKQKQIEITSDGKGVRFDIYLEDEDETVYDIEMQTTIGRNLAKRSRYYQGMIDLNLIERGEDYKNLKKSYVIFICLDDVFQRGRHIYTFTNRCEQCDDLYLGDDTWKIFLCAHGTADDVSPKMKSFLNYLVDHQAEDSFTKKLEQEVDRARNAKEWRLEYMTLQMRDQEKWEQGLEQGLEQRHIETLQELHISKADAIVRVMQKFDYDQEEATEKVDKYWKFL